mmetsp:Transcript_4217/g.11663  ORF Transcript_4217/g.11663 Transcript_4217/m.11663 type:complete len:83 (-) Transcript_4217:2011-2259(-)
MRAGAKPYGVGVERTSVANVDIMAAHDALDTLTSFGGEVFDGGKWSKEALADAMLGRSGQDAFSKRVLTSMLGTRCEEQDIL